MKKILLGLLAVAFISFAAPAIMAADTTAPTVDVTSPAAKDKFIGGEAITVSFTSSDDTGVVSHDIHLSRDGGATFTPLANGVAGNVQSFQVTLPDVKISFAVIKVIARDAAGNSGEGVSGAFKIKATHN